jgi:hypothetical protein
MDREWKSFPPICCYVLSTNLLIAEFVLFEGPTNHAGLDQAIKQEVDLKTRNKLPMIAMTSLESRLPAYEVFGPRLAHAAGELIDTPDNQMAGDQPVCTVYFQREACDNEI